MGYFKKKIIFVSFIWVQIYRELDFFGLQMLKSVFMSKFTNRRLHRAEVNRILWQKNCLLRERLTYLSKNIAQSYRY